jgi:hypothetical protein
MLRAPAFALVFLTVGCNRVATDAAPSPSASPSAASAVAPSPSSSRDHAVGFGGGHASSGPGHESMKIESRDGPRDANFGSLYRDLGACYKASPHRAANEAVRVSMQVAVDPSGAVTMNPTTKIGVLVDKGHGEQGYAFDAEPTKNDAVLKCIEEATKAATVTVPEWARGTSFSVTIEVSP